MGVATNGPRKSSEEGPFVTFLSERLTHARSHYFRTGNPSEVANYVWLRIWVQSPLTAILFEAWEKGKQVQVFVGYPNQSPDGKKTATIKQARILW